jgi:hypothetical protein
MVWLNLQKSDKKDNGLEFPSGSQFLSSLVVLNNE